MEDESKKDVLTENIAKPTRKKIMMLLPKYEDD